MVLKIHALTISMISKYLKGFSTFQKLLIFRIYDSESLSRMAKVHNIEAKLKGLSHEIDFKNFDKKDT
jgi:hypothetical protein